MENAEKKATRIGLAELARIMRGAQVSISKNVNDSLTNPSMSSAKWQTKQRQISAAYQFIRNKWAEYAGKQIPKQYNASVNRTLKAMGRSLQDDVPAINTVNAIVLDTVSRMNLATKNGEQLVETLFLETQQAIVSDRLISRKIAEGLVTDATPDNLSKVVRGELAKKLGNEQVLEINGRSYKADKYSTLVARTRTREAQTQGAIDTVKSFGEDLVQWSEHNHEEDDEDLCWKYEGNIYSLSGSHPKYDLLPEAPPLHPNCQHVLLPYVE